MSEVAAVTTCPRCGRPIIPNSLCGACMAASFSAVSAELARTLAAAQESCRVFAASLTSEQIRCIAREPTDAELRRGREIYAGKTDASSPDTSQTYFLDLLTRIDDATG
jgi:hypothetical protein